MVRAPHHAWPHRQAREYWLARTLPTDPCKICNRTLGSTPRHWDLAHDDNNPGHYLGMAHRSCNRGDWAKSPRANGRTDPPAHIHLDEWGGDQ